ncbi:MAG: MarR family transcriptional regulator [Rhizobiales bacterium 63-7]|nr:MarR family transcriptional regulator [Hyphomicrobiales bacterium]OJU66527.1 MAG: MarR family transcriptional regulator [Rhizobiales bacterium 63-7]
MGKKKEGKKNKSARKKNREEVTLDFAQAVTQAARSVRTALSRNLLDGGLYAGQDGVIMALFEADGMTPGALAQRLGVKAPTMTRTIGRMEAQGFVRRQADAQDQRQTKVHLTEAGQGSVELISRAAAACDELALKGFSDKERRVLIRLLRAVDLNLQGIEPPAAEEE